jgi:conjugative relaxase-like TrwC/TraI family protein
VLNIGKLRRGGENYYLNSVARGVEDYYLGSGEAPGYWLASGATALGLEGAVGDEALRMVLKGASPNSGRKLVEPRKGERVPGFDLTFLAPKSVALLHELGSKETSNKAVSAHDAAVAAALGYLERQASGARRGKGGRIAIPSKGFIGAAFRHRTSRAGDPLLHTHVLVANLIKGDDGRWGALDAQHLYRHAKTAGYLYQAHLRSELTRQLGVGWAPVSKGAADIDGIPRAAVVAFSKRRLEVEAVVGERAEATGRQREVAALVTRQAKDYSVSPQRLLPEWRARAAEVGLTDDVLSKALGKYNDRAIDADGHREMERALLSPQGLTSQQSSFTRREVLQGFCARLPHGGGVSDIEDMADSFLASSEVLNLSAADEHPEAFARNEVRYTTSEMLGLERHVVDRAVGRRNDDVGIADPVAVRSTLASRPTLFDDQRSMVARITTSGSGVEIVVGKAGAGKTFALDAAREAWKASGYEVVGCTLAARAARELEAGSGIPSYTIAGLLRDIENPRAGGLPNNSILVVDEAGMVGTRQLDRLLNHAERAGAKAVLVGDDRQLPEIEAGGAFRGIKNRLSAIELSEVRRQPYGWERDVLDLVRDGRAREAVDEYLAHDRVVIGISSEATRQRLIADWWATQNDPEPAVMIAAHRSDVADLNERARAVMASAGKLGSQEIQFGGVPFAIADRAMTLKNSSRLGVSNGDRGTILRVDLGRGEIDMHCDNGTLVTLPRSYLEAGHLTHAYALTGHKTQAMTTNKAFVLGDETLYREWTYVAMSRGRNDNRLYVVAGIDLEREEVGGQVAGIEDPLEEVIDAVGRSRAKDLALDVRARHRDIEGELEDHGIELEIEL